MKKKQPGRFLLLLLFNYGREKREGASGAENKRLSSRLMANWPFGGQGFVLCR